MIKFSHLRSSDFGIYCSQFSACGLISLSSPHLTNTLKPTNALDCYCQASVKVDLKKYLVTVDLSIITITTS